MDDSRRIVIEKLASMPAVLQAAFDGAGDRASKPSAQGEWSLIDVLRHVRASDAIITPRIYQALIRDEPLLLGYDERAWGGLLAPSGVAPLDQLRHFVIGRAELVGALRRIKPEQWLRAGQHETRGRMSIEDLCAALAEHEAEHRVQVEAIVSRA